MIALVEHPAFFIRAIVRIHHATLSVICADRITIFFAKLIVGTHNFKYKLAVFFPRPAEVKLPFAIVLFFTVFTEPIHAGFAVDFPFFLGGSIGSQQLNSSLTSPEFIGRSNVGEYQQTKYKFLHLYQSLIEGSEGHYPLKDRGVQ